MKRMWRQNEFISITKTVQPVEKVQTSGKRLRRLTIFNPRPKHVQNPQSFHRILIHITS